MSRVGWGARPGPAMLARPASNAPVPLASAQTRTHHWVEGDVSCVDPDGRAPHPLLVPYAGLQIRASAPYLGGLQGDRLQGGTKPASPETLNSHRERSYVKGLSLRQLRCEGKEPLFSGFWETGLQNEDSFLPDILFPRQRRGPENESPGMKGL